MLSSKVYETKWIGIAQIVMKIVTATNLYPTTNMSKWLLKEKNERRVWSSFCF